MILTTVFDEMRWDEAYYFSIIFSLRVCNALWTSHWSVYMSKLIFMFRFTHQLFCQIVFFEFVSAHQHVKLHTMRSIHIHTAQQTPRQMDGKKKRSQTIRMIDTRIRLGFYYCTYACTSRSHAPKYICVHWHCCCWSYSNVAHNSRF